VMRGPNTTKAVSQTHTPHTETTKTPQKRLPLYLKITEELPLPALISVGAALLDAPTACGKGVLDAVASLVLVHSRVEHAAGVPEKGTGLVVQVITAARNRGGVEENVPVSLAVGPSGQHV